jgi:hypothetical protein
VFVAASAVQGYAAVQFVRALRQSGLGLSSNAWHHSPTIAYLKSLPDRRLYSNDLPALYFLAGREASFVPTSFNDALNQRRADFLADLERMRADVDCRGALVVIVGSNPAGRLPRESAGVLAGLELLAEFNDGLVYGASPNSCPE